MAYVLIVSLSLLAAGTCKLYPANNQFDGQLPEETFMPNERISLDDCYLRYFRLGNRGLVAPAFGEKTVLKEFAHIGAIGWTAADGQVKWNCGGSLIRENYVLSAGHCAVDESNKAPDVVRFGDINIYSDHDDQYAQQLRIVEIIRHHGHRFSSRYNDLALFRLERNISLHPTVAPACLWLDDEVRFKTLLAAGWGKTGFAEEQTPVLLKVSLKVMEKESCSKFYPKDRLLKNGLEDHQLCAGDEKMDTCPGDSGGPLEIKLLHNTKITPFLVGVTSFGLPCGLTNPGVYVKISAFKNWILSTLQQRGEVVSEADFEPHACALRYVHLREYESAVATISDDGYRSVDTDKMHMAFGSSELQAKIKWSSHLPAKEECRGTLIDESMIATLAECALNAGKLPSHVELLGETNNVTEVFIHPNYIKGSLHNNIALLRINDSVQFSSNLQPLCLWTYGKLPANRAEIRGHGPRDLNLFLYDEPAPESDRTIVALAPRGDIYSNDNCNLSAAIRARLPRGLQSEHICFGNEIFLVPGACELSIGATVQRYVWRLGIYFMNVFGLNMAGRDCGFGEPGLAVRFADHVEWMKSVILPKRQSSDSVLFLNRDLRENDPCRSQGTRDGVCVQMVHCPTVRGDVLLNYPVTFCSTGSLVCCPREQIVRDTSKLINSQAVAELDSCAVRHRGASTTDKLKALPHIADIGWFQGPTTVFECTGVLITSRAVISTAGCILDHRRPPQVVRSGFAVTAGTSNDFSVTAIKDVIFHDSFNELTNKPDIALLVLANAVQLTVNKFPACLWQNLTHTPLLMDAYTETKNSYSAPTLQPIYNGDCRNRIIDELDIDTSQLCAYKTFGGQQCFNNGDPLFKIQQNSDNTSTTYLVGMFSYGACDSEDIQVYTRISHYVDWIKLHL